MHNLGGTDAASWWPAVTRLAINNAAAFYEDYCAGAHKLLGVTDNALQKLSTGASLAAMPWLSLLSERKPRVVVGLLGDAYELK